MQTRIFKRVPRNPLRSQKPSSIAEPVESRRAAARGPSCLGDPFPNGPSQAESYNIARSKTDRSRMEVHLIDGTYELFRHFFAVPAAADMNGQEIGATRGVLASVLSMIERGATHIVVATDHVVESFRNDLYPGYKTSEGVPPELLSQFPILEERLEAMGVVVWPMVYYEADDALASPSATPARHAL